ncbi:hypothetical protein [Streptomyces sp. NPDC001880]
MLCTLTITPARTALLAMNFQNAIVPLVPEPDALLTRVQDAITAVRAAGGTIGRVRVAFTPDDWEAIPDRNTSLSSIAATRAMHHEDETMQIHEMIAPGFCPADLGLWEDAIHDLHPKGPCRVEHQLHFGRGNAAGEDPG